MISDEQIIERVLKGHTQDYRELMQRHQAAVFRLAYRILGRREEAEDAAQETFVKAYRKLNTCRERRKFWRWLRRIALNICLGKLSRGRPSDNVNELPDADCLPHGSVESEVLMRAQMEDIRRAIAGLPDAYRTTVILRYQEELSYKEIAELLGETLTAIQVRLHRARKMLAARLEVMTDEMR